jgi:GGDEF domain-containing protein
LIDRSKCPHFGISAGAVVTPTGLDVDYDEIYKSADREMYCVKNTGGNNYRVVDTL